MPRLTKLYTRNGDDGTTSLGNGQRVPKDDLRVQAYGAVDELNSFIGYALALELSSRLQESLPTIQNELFHLGADLAYPQEEDGIAVPRIEEHHVKALEALIDELNQQVGKLENFILPGGCAGAAALQVSRAVCRRAERVVATLARQERAGVSAHVQAYLNRLSDALFVMARYENKQRGVAEPLWDSHV
jgi:cob(I)alamin adenosyltransferase